MADNDRPCARVIDREDHNPHGWSGMDGGDWRCPGWATPIGLLSVAATDVWHWFKELEAQGIRIKDGKNGAKVKEEASEFYDEPSLDEAADVFIALCGGVESLGHSQDELAAAVIRKMTVNRERKWEQRPDGTYHHVKEQV